MQVMVEVSIDSLVEELVTNATFDKAFEVIKKIDSEMQMWDFTELCFEYFKNEMARQS